MMDSCPNCNHGLSFVGQIDYGYNRYSFFKCKGGCHRIFEKTFDDLMEKFKYVDIHVVYQEIKNSRVAS